LNLIVVFAIVFISFIIIFSAIENLQILYIIMSLTILPFIYYLASKKWSVLIFILLFFEFRTFKLLPTEVLFGIKLPMGGRVHLSDISFFFLILISLRKEFINRWDPKLFNKSYIKFIILILIIVIYQLISALLFDKGITTNNIIRYIRNSSVFFIAILFIVQLNSKDKVNNLIKILYCLGTLYATFVILAFIGRFTNITFLARLSPGHIMTYQETGRTYIRIFEGSGIPLLAFVSFYSVSSFIDKSFILIKRKYIIVSLIITSFAIIFTGVRSVYISIPISIIISTLLTIKELKFEVFKPIYSFLLILLLVGLILFFINPLLINIFLERILSLQNMQQLATFQSRLRQIEYSLSVIFNQKAFLGLGVDYEDRYLQAMGDKNFFDPNRRIEYYPLADCGYSEYLIKFGFIGLIVFVGIIFTSINELKNIKGKTKRENIVLIQTIMACFIFYLIKGYSSKIGARDIAVATFLSLLIAFTAVLSHYENEEDDKKI